MPVHTTLHSALQPVYEPDSWDLALAIPMPPGWNLPPQETDIVDAGASGLYFTPEAPVMNINEWAPKITVGSVSGQPFVSKSACEMARPELKGRLALDGHVMPGFKHNLAGISKWCDEDCTVKYTKTDVTIYNPQGVPIVRGWRESPPSKLWRMALVPHKDQQDQQMQDHKGETVPLSAFSVYDLPSVEALVRFFHAAAGYPVKTTWLSAIKKGYFKTWPGLTYANASKYCPLATETLKGHLTQVRQGVRSTKNRLPQAKPDAERT